MSKKRILPAILLAASVGFLGLHRLYAGRIVTGLVQLVLFVSGAAFLWRATQGIQNIETLDQAQDWLTSHPIPLFPVILVGIPSFWALVDCAQLLAKAFKDGAGVKITRWI